MTHTRKTIGSLSTRRRFVTWIAVIGVAFVGHRLTRLWPRTLSVSYDAGPKVTDLYVDYVLDDAAIRSVRLRSRREQPGLFRHRVRLKPGAYELRITVYRKSEAATETSRHLTVPMPRPGDVRFDLRADALK